MYKKSGEIGGEDCHVFYQFVVNNIKLFCYKNALFHSNLMSLLIMGRVA